MKETFEIGKRYVFVDEENSLYIWKRIGDMCWQMELSLELGITGWSKPFSHHTYIGEL